jgi:transposase
MSRPSDRFVRPLTETQRQELQHIWKEHDSHRTRCRAHAVLLSDRGWTINDLCEAFEVSRPTASGWLQRWEAEGIGGLEDEPRSGAPPKLGQTEQAELIERVKQDPRNPQQAIEQTARQTGKSISRRTLRRILRRCQMRWKRTRRSVSDRRNATAFALAREELQEFRALDAAGEIHLWFFDEAGFSLQPSNGNAWQPVGETVRLPSRKGGSLTALGFLDLESRLHPYEFEGAADSDVAIAVFDHFAAQIKEPAVVVLDNAPVHTSTKFQNRIPIWADQGVSTYFLPPFSPELNLIEILWREIKNRWLPISAYMSGINTLWDELGKTLASIGKRYKINFSSC